MINPSLLQNVFVPIYAFSPPNCVCNCWSIWSPYGSFSPGRGKWAKSVIIFSEKIQDSKSRDTDSYIGSFPQDGENEQNLSFFSFFWSFTVTKRFDFYKFSQLFWRDYVRYSLKILSFALQKNFGVPCSTPVFALLSDFSVKISHLLVPPKISNVANFFQIFKRG